MKFCKKKECRSRKASVMHSVMKHHWDAGSETYAPIPSWLTNVFPALRLRTVPKAAGWLYRKFSSGEENFSRTDWGTELVLLITCWDESGLQAWFNAKPGQMCLLKQPRHCPGVEGRQPNTGCSHKTWYLLLKQKLRSKPEKILESHNLTCKTKTDKHLNYHCNLCKMNHYSHNYLNYMS